MRTSQRLIGLLLATVACFAAQAVTYDVGPSQTYTNIGDVPWESLVPGDRVEIQYRATPYAEKWVIGVSGTAANPITVAGIPDGSGNLPVITGDNATTRTALSYTRENRGVIKIGTANTPSQTGSPEYIVIENLEIRSAHPSYTFTDDAGTPGNSYNNNAASIDIERGENITIRNCTIHDSGNGIFSSFNTVNLTIEGCYIYGNGISGSGLYHNTYIEAQGVTYQYNRYGPLRSGATGNPLKDRSSGTVVRYNWIEGGNRQLDLVESHEAVINADASYDTTYVYGNVLIEPGDIGNSQIVHYGGDEGVTADYRDGTLYFYNNTVISERTTSTTLFRLQLAAANVQARNNIFYPTTHGGGTLFNLESNIGTANFQNNWFPTGWSVTTNVTDDGDNLVEASPAFNDAGNEDFTLDASSSAIDAGAALHASVLPTHDLVRQYSKHQSSAARSQIGAAIDIGAFEASTGGEPEIAVSGNSQDITDGDNAPESADGTNFGDVSVGSAANQSFTVDNTGAATLTLSVAISGSSEFSLGSTPTSIGAGSNDSFTVTYTPTDAGGSTATITITNNDSSENPFTYTLAGAGVLALTADSTSSGNGAGNGTADSYLITQAGGNLTISVNGQVLGTFSNTNPVTITGSSDDDTLTVDLGGGSMPNITYHGGSGTDSLVFLNANGTTLTYTPSNTTDGTVDLDGNVLTFTGLSPITYTGTLADVFVNVTATGAQTIDISATATDTTVDANGTFELITFTNATNSLTVNAGDGNDIINLNSYAGAAIDIDLNGEAGNDNVNTDFSAVGSNTLTTDGGSDTDIFTFDPEGNAIVDTGTQITGLPNAISYSNFSSVVTVGEIDITANGNAIADGSVATSLNNHTDFGTAVVGVANINRTYTISNTGTASINITVPVTITGTNSSAFTVTAQPAATVSPSSSTTFNVLFAPATTGSFSAQVNSTNDDTDENPYTFAITGTGGTAAAAAAVPTMGEWAMLTLAFGLGCFALLYMRRETLPPAHSATAAALLVLDRRLFKHCLLVACSLVALGLALAFALTGSVQASDAIGAPLCALVSAYFAHLVMLLRQ